MNNTDRDAAKKLGQFIIAARKQRNMTRAELIRRTGLALSVTQRIEQGNANPTLGTLKKLTTALGFRLCIHPDGPPFTYLLT